MPANPAPAEATQPTQDRRKRQVYAEQIRLLYTNANAGVWVTVFAAILLSYLQWGIISHPIRSGLVDVYAGDIVREVHSGALLLARGRDGYKHSQMG